MPRPKLRRRVGCNLKTCFFKPQGLPLRKMKTVSLSKEEVETLRLKNIKKLDQINAAKEMNTSQSTFQRILSSAYQKISDAIVNGKAIQINKNNE